MEKLKLALIHLNVRYRKPEENRERLFRSVSEAAARGAKIVVAPEMSVSGYSFESRDEIAPLAETGDGPTTTGLAGLSERHGIYVCVGIAEKDPWTGILYNSAFVLGPEGRTVSRYRKINAESRWACPGDPRQDNTFETPWGRAGVLICSDAYHGLMPRATALRGANLLLAPSNWPPSGLDPAELWRARALENGFYLAACNRTGVDRIMDCRDASSYVFDPSGRTLLEGKNEDTGIFVAELPLDSNGRIDGKARLNRLADRRPSHYYDCYLNLRMIRDLTGFLKLPEPAVVKVNCVVPEAGKHPVESLKDHLKGNGRENKGLYLLSPYDFSDGALETVERIACDTGAGVVACNLENGDSTIRLFRARKSRRAMATCEMAVRKRGRLSHARFRTAPLVSGTLFRDAAPGTGRGGLEKRMRPGLVVRGAPVARTKAPCRNPHDREHGDGDLRRRRRGRMDSPGGTPTLGRIRSGSRRNMRRFLGHGAYPLEEVSG